MDLRRAEHIVPSGGSFCRVHVAFRSAIARYSQREGLGRILEDGEIQKKYLRGEEGEIQSIERFQLCRRAHRALRC